ncbi:MAG TPA: RsmE family RNA methyltransferase [Kofleriaceae bacterium]|nr:RsmE family RNA methyltransferase [Kofleriaceae bacterium]
MNLLLFEPDELAGGAAVLRDRRAAHVREVLRASAGTTLRAGVVRGPVGTAEVIEITADHVTLAFEARGDASAPAPIDLILAVPRPKVLRRVLQFAASCAVRRIDLINAWKVDKSYFGSAKVEDRSIAEDLRLGAEQGATTWLPDVRVHARFMQFLDEHAPTATHKLCAHARDADPIEQRYRGGDVALAIGPEGGWIDREVDTFALRGFAIVSLGAPILRVEAAVASALGQLALLQRLGK